MIEYGLEFTQQALDDIERHRKSGNNVTIMIDKTYSYSAILFSFLKWLIRAI